PDRQEGQHWRRTSSAEWIRMMDSYAQSRGFVGMASFYNLFLCYDYGPKPGTFIDVWFALDDRQESFFALQDIAG
ncbi:MAG: hypothetical protein HXS50_04135, partial [Theionarchaea archaeon]|nr:hypothetical protein [Theionarchaea archaeon]